MRLKAEIWVKAYIRLCFSRGTFAAVVRHGDDDAGAIFIRINCLNGTSYLLVPVAAGFEGTESARRWQHAFDGNACADAEVDRYLEREMNFDSDLWIVEVESRDGLHLLDDQLA